MKTSTNYRDRLRSLRADDAGINLGNMIVTLIGMAIIGGISMAAVMVVIPWFQDGAAERETDSVSVAQESYYGMYGADRQNEPRYASTEQLVDADLLSADWLEGGAVINRVGTGVNSGWETFVRSSSDEVMYNNSERATACKLVSASAMPDADSSVSSFSNVDCVGDTD